MTLDRLWADWRLGLRRRDDRCPATPAGGSVFDADPRERRARRGDARALARGADCFAILNAFPYGSGHLLVMPYREVAALEDLGADESRRAVG